MDTYVNGIQGLVWTNEFFREAIKVHSQKSVSNHVRGHAITRAGIFISYAPEIALRDRHQRFKILVILKPIWVPSQK